MGAIGLNPIRLDRIGLDPIRINAIKLGVPGASGTERPYIDPEVLASLKAVCICYGKSNDDPDRAVVKNLVDPDNPFVISNAAFKLNSGFGKYEITFQYFPYIENVTNVSDSKVVFGIGGQLLIPYPAITENIPSFKIKVNGLSGTYHFRYYYRSSDGVQHSVDMAQDGYYELPICYNVQSSSDGTNCGFANNGNDVVTITQIPSFEGAFVTDGIDDLITSTKTVQEMLGGSNEITVVSMIHKMSSDMNWSNLIGELKGNHTFVANRGINTDKTGIYGYTYNYVGDAIVINNILGDKNDYITRTTTSLGLTNKYYVTGFENAGSITGISQIAWFWTIIANKVLTTDQINQVIAYFNLDRCVEPTVLYDVKRQGLSNDTPDSDWYLKDFSKNGFDMSLFNFTKKGMSGVNGYPVIFGANKTWNTAITGSNYIANFTNTTINITKVNQSLTGVLYSYVKNNDTLVNIKEIPSFKISIKGLEGKSKLGYKYLATDNAASSTIMYLENGTHALPKSFAPTEALLDLTYNEWIGFFISSISEGTTAFDCDITIEVLPSHAGALCLDGVNDYGKVTGLPIYKDYTVVADREIVDGLAASADGGVALKGNKYLTGAFVFDYKDRCWSFGGPKMIPLNTKRFISYQSKYVSNGISVDVGTATDNDELWIGRLGNEERYSKLAIRFLMSFPYSMSEFLIERQLKKHKLGTLYPDMVEFRPIVKSNLPYSSITYSVNPGEYISVDSMVTITVTLPNTSDKLMEVSCNAISDISISGDNGVYEITGKIVKSPQKINLVISSYLTMLNNETLISNETLIKNE